MRQPVRLAMIGWGAIGRRVAELLAPSEVRFVAIGLRDRSVPRPDLPAGAAVVDSPEALRGLDVDWVIEAAGRAAVEPWGMEALACARGFVVSSTSAFCDAAVLLRLRDAAERHGSQIFVPPGALGGIDALAAASALGMDEVVHTIIKPPRAWKGTAAEQMLDLDRLDAPATFFIGTADTVAERFPQNANVAVISALAGIGLDRTQVHLAADPGATRNCHQITASGAFGRLAVTIENRPLAANPKSSEMTALSLVRLVRNRTHWLAI